MPSKEKTGGKINYVRKQETTCLTEKQTNYVYKASRRGKYYQYQDNSACETMQNQDDNPYKKVVLNKVFREEDKSPKMRNWSIFSDNARYIQHEQKTPQNLNTDTLRLQTS